ncbi:MAG TPA: M24 family metallopeptidase, partial [Tepidisphaeraceae bacterium]|nr:M24 family metallopeptidase [Tepidisphaeraceae bacterium]
MLDLTATQLAMRQAGIDGWLVWDFRNSNSVLGRLLGSGRKHLTRRVMLWIPAHGAPTLLSSAIDAGQFTSIPIARQTYISYSELLDRLRGLLAGKRRVAMEYVPGGQLPAVSVVDAGTVELVRSLGPDVVSSADLIQLAVGVWGSEARRGHDQASCKVACIKDEAFDLIRAAHRASRSIDERTVQQHILSRFAALGLETNDEPIVAVNAHSGDPHYAPTDASTLPIRPGDWVLIDLWARLPGEQHIFSDITWVGYCGPDVPAAMRHAFDVVKAARDAALDAAVGAWNE